MAGPGNEAVQEGIERLQSRFGSFPVNQTTLSVSSDTYETARARAREGLADVYVRVRNDAGEVLHVDDDGEPVVPRCVSDCGATLTRTVRADVREATGIDCAVEDIERATIAGIHSQADEELDPVYRLAVLLDAVPSMGNVDGAVWREDGLAVPAYV